MSVSRCAFRVSRLAGQLCDLWKLLWCIGDCFTRENRGANGAACFCFCRLHSASDCCRSCCTVACSSLLHVSALGRCSSAPGSHLAAAAEVQAQQCQQLQHVAQQQRLLGMREWHRNAEEAARHARCCAAKMNTSCKLHHTRRHLCTWLGAVAVPACLHSLMTLADVSA